MRILKTYGRLWVDDLDQALVPLRVMLGREPDIRFEFDQVKGAAIGDFLVIDVPRDQQAKYPASATVVVSDLDELTRVLHAHGAKITIPEAPGPTGRFLYARHADGSEVEYVEWTSDLVQRILG